MPHPDRRAVLAVLACMAAAPRVAHADPRRYRLDPDGSSVGFAFAFTGGGNNTGQMPVTRADIRIDPDNLAASTADVTVSAAGLRTGLFIATDALKGPDLLDTARFPEIRFVSTRVRLAPSGRLSDGASLEGQLTVRGVTRGVRLEAAIYRPPGTDPSDLDRLIIHLTGTISRSAFGAIGYAGAVADAVGLDIRAHLDVMQ